MYNMIFLPDLEKDESIVRDIVFKWKVGNCSPVQKDDLLMEVILSTGKVYKIISPRNGFLVRILDKDFKVKSPFIRGVDVKYAKKVAVAGLFNSFEDYIEKRFKSKPMVEVDDFTDQLTIRWERIAKPLFNIYYSQECGCLKDLAFFLPVNDFAPYGEKQMPLAYYQNNYIFAFSYIYENGMGFIEFSYDSKEIKLKKNDTISFLFENGDILDCSIAMKPYLKENEAKTYRHFRCQLYFEDINLLVNERISKWRISFSESGKLAITTDINGESIFVKKKKQDVIALYKTIDDLGILSDKYSYLFDGGNKDVTKILPFLIQQYTKDYVKVLQRNCPEYEFPKKKYPQNAVTNSPNAFDWCYVYLMKDMNNGYYKIGISNNPEYREHTLQSEKPVIEMIGCKKYPSRKIAEAFEKALHQTYNNQRIRGEWFSLSELDVEVLLESFK